MNTFTKQRDYKNDDDEQFLDFEEERWDCSKIRDTSNYWEENPKVSDDLMKKIKQEIANQQSNK